MSQRRTISRSVLFLIAVAALPRLPTSGSGAAAGQNPPPDRAASLKARIRELEEAAGALSREIEALSSRPPAAAANPGVIGTDDAMEAGLRARLGISPPEQIQSLISKVDNLKGPELARDLEELLLRGEQGYAILFDFLHEIGKDYKRTLLMTVHYHLTFSLMHLAMKHEDATARFAHYALSAVQVQQLDTRVIRLLHGYLPVFLRYHQGRFPDLERDFKKHLLIQLAQPIDSLPAVFTAISEFGYIPPIEPIERLLGEASAPEHISMVIDHLAQRNDEAAVRAICRAVEQNRLSDNAKLPLCMTAFARMSVKEAGEVLSQYLSLPDQPVQEAALRGYFSVPRRAEAGEALLIALRFLNSNAALQAKRALISQLRQGNAGIIELLRKDLQKVNEEEVRLLISGLTLPPRKAGT